jgi:hypothetical protein
MTPMRGGDGDGDVGDYGKEECSVSSVGSDANSAMGDFLDDFAELDTDDDDDDGGGKKLNTAEAAAAAAGSDAEDEVGLCTLNSFDPYPITYSLSNP